MSSTFVTINIDVACKGKDDDVANMKRRLSALLKAGWDEVNNPDFLRKLLGDELDEIDDLYDVEDEDERSGIFSGLYVYDWDYFNEDILQFDCKIPDRDTEAECTEQFTRALTKIFPRVEFYGIRWGYTSWGTYVIYEEDFEKYIWNEDEDGEAKKDAYVAWQCAVRELMFLPDNTSPKARAAAVKTKNDARAAFIEIAEIDEEELDDWDPPASADDEDEASDTNDVDDVLNKDFFYGTWLYDNGATEAFTDYTWEYKSADSKFHYKTIIDNWKLSKNNKKNKLEYPLIANISSTVNEVLGGMVKIDSKINGFYYINTDKKVICNSDGDILKKRDCDLSSATGQACPKCKKIARPGETSVSTEPVKKDAAQEAFKLGYDYFNKNDIDSTIKQLDKALKLNPEYADAYHVKMALNNMNSKKSYKKQTNKELLDELLMDPPSQFAAEWVEKIRAKKAAG